MTSHETAVEVLTELLHHYEREVQRFTEQVKHRLNQIDAAPGEDHKLQNQLIAKAEEHAEEYATKAQQLRASIAVLQAAGATAATSNETIDQMIENLQRLRWIKNGKR